MNINIYIDGKAADADSGSTVSLSVDAEKTMSVESHETGILWKDISLPATPKNCSLFGFSNQILSASHFNNAMHELCICADSATVLFEGYVKLMEYTQDGGEARFRIRPVTLDEDWARCIGTKPLSTMFGDYEATVGGDAIVQSWSGTPLVKFLPVARDTDDKANLTVKKLSTADYHPFIHLYSVVRQIFADAGYSLSSSFAEGALFRSLYFSGSYKSADINELKQKMDFLAGRFADKSTVADRYGRVFCDPGMLINTLGNLVDTADPDELYSGSKAENVYDNGGCFSKPGNYVCFTPKSKVTAGFEYRLRYTTGYRIKNRNELTGFNTVTLGANDSRTFTIANPFKDCRSSFQGGVNFRCVVFDYVQGETYRLIATYKTGALETNVTITDFASRSCVVGTSLMQTFTKVTLYRKDSTGIFYVYSGDWALYYGYIEETGSQEVKVTLRSAPEEISPAAPKMFHSIIFSGAESGMSITLHKDSTVRPVFMPHPPEGTSLKFSDITARGIKRTELLKSIEQMFCLRFYADPLKKTVYMEPDSAFYGAKTLDWTHKIDLDKPVTIKEPDHEADKITLRYAKSSGTVSRWNEQTGDMLGQCEYGVQKPYSKPSKSRANPLFAPSLNVKGIHPSAGSSLVISVGDRDSSVDSLDFDNRIVSWRGMQALSLNEKWDWPSYGSNYPLAAFVLTASTADTPVFLSPSPVSLCFEDRDSQPGLGSYHKNLIERYRRARELTLYLHLSPDDVSQILSPGISGAGLRATYSFVIEKEKTAWILSRITDYSPTKGPAKCTFTQLL